MTQAHDCLLDLLVLLASVASGFFGAQYPVFRGTVQFIVYDVSLRLRHVEAALSWEVVHIFDVELEGQHCGADCRVGFRRLD